MLRDPPRAPMAPRNPKDTQLIKRKRKLREFIAAHPNGGDAEFAALVSTIDVALAEYRAEAVMAACSYIWEFMGSLRAMLPDRDAAIIAAERDRILKIIAPASGDGARFERALHLAFETDMPAAAALAALNKSPASGRPH